MSKKLRKIVVYLEKGGVGKTMTAIHTAAGLARMGKKVLLIDLDPQMQCVTRLGLSDESLPPISLAEAMRLKMSDPKKVSKALLEKAYKAGWPMENENTAKGKAKKLKALVMKAREGLYLIPGGRDLSRMQFELNVMNDWQYALDKTLGFLDNSGMDFIVMDTNPSWTPLSAVAMFWGNELCFPIACGNDDLKSLASFQHELGQVLDMRDGDLEVVYILPTMFKKSLPEHRDIIKYLRKSYPEKFCEPISERIRIAECGGRGETIYEYEKDNPAAREYMAFVKKIIERGE